jgi:hypothetical protein
MLTDEKGFSSLVLRHVKFQIVSPRVPLAGVPLWLLSEGSANVTLARVRLSATTGAIVYLRGDESLKYSPVVSGAPYFVVTNLLKVSRRLLAPVKIFTNVERRCLAC